MARYDVQDALGYSPDNAVTPALVNTPVIFIAPSAKTVASGELWMAVSSNDANYGGCIVHVSNDGTTYYELDRLFGNSIQGVLTAALPAATGTDTSHTLGIDLSMSNSIIEPVDQHTVDALDSLCYVGGEFLAYRDEALTGVDAYNLNYLKRGLYGSTPGAANASPFVLLAGVLFKYRFNQHNVGNTLYFKFQGFNLVEGGLQDMADLVAYSFVVSADGGVKALLSDVAAASTWSAISGKPTTISDFGITDAYTKTEVNFGLSGKQNSLTLTTAGTSGAATLTGSTLNIPSYSGGGGGSSSNDVFNYLNF